ncbi:hypothetical protein ACI792_04310 [Blastococcus sp. SYSU DS0669]
MSTSTDFEYFTADGEYELETALGLAGPPAASSPALLMEHLGALAANAESEAEAEAFLGALVPLATKLAPAIARATPQLVRGVAKVGRQLWRNPSTRRLVAAVPQVVQRTAADLARQHGRGAPLTTQAATRSLAKQVANVLDDPAKRRRAVQRCRALDRRWHATRKNAGGVPAPGSRRCTCR